MRQQYFHLGKIYRDIVYINRVPVLVARAGKNRCSGVKHHRNSIGFGCAVDHLKFLNTGQIIVRKQQLVRRMNLDHANS